MTTSPANTDSHDLNRFGDDWEFYNDGGFDAHVWAYKFTLQPDYGDEEIPL